MRQRSPYFVNSGTVASEAAQMPERKIVVVGPSAWAETDGRELHMGLRKLGAEPLILQQEMLTAASIRRSLGGASHFVLALPSVQGGDPEILRQQEDVLLRAARNAGIGKIGFLNLAPEAAWRHSRAFETGISFVIVSTDNERAALKAIYPELKVERTLLYRDITLATATADSIVKI